MKGFDTVQTGAPHKRWLPWLLVITFITRLILAFRPDVMLVWRPYTEDAFYIMSCAFHLAHGGGLSTDGVHLTNGIQPLIAFLYAPCFWIAGADKWLGLRLTFIILAALETFAVYAIYHLLHTLCRNSHTDDQRTTAYTPIIGAALWTFLYTLLVHDANGLETGLYSVLIICVLWHYSVLQKQVTTVKASQWIKLGILMGFMVLARIDGALLVASFALVDIWSRRKKEEGIVSVIKPAFLFSIVALIVSSPWWIYNQTVFGSLMPISGQSESLRDMVWLNISSTAEILGDVISTFFYTPFNAWPAWVYYLWFAFGITVILWCNKRYQLLRRIKQEFAITNLNGLLLGGIVLIGYYTLIFQAPHFINRYLQRTPFTLIRGIASI